MSDRFSELFIPPETSINKAMQKMDSVAKKVLIVVDSMNRLLGVLTDGDIRRFILRTGSIKGNIQECYNKSFIFLREGDTVNLAKKLMIEKKIEMIPVVDKDLRVANIFIWSDIFQGHRKSPPSKIDCPVVIMAGGKGTRLDPFTKILPKPLIPLGEKTILEIIMDKFSEYGINNFYLTINYKGEMIKSYLENIGLNYKINYIREKNFLGTAGSLGFLPTDFPQTFIVSNCDILVDADYYELLKFHKKNGNILTLIGSIQHIVVPYGVIEFSVNGSLKKIIEKPKLETTINTGVYILEKKTISYVPQNKPFDITDLIKILMENGKKIGVFPVSEKSYIDIGQWGEYKKNMKYLVVKEDNY